MKKRILLIGLAAMVSGVASATVIWSENFDAPVTVINGDNILIDDNNVNTFYDFWTTEVTNSQFEITLPKGEQTRGAAIAINNGSMPDTTGDSTFYRLTFDITRRDGGAKLSMKINDGQRDAGLEPVNGYKLKTAGPAWGNMDPYAVGTGSVANMMDVEYQVTGTQTMDFEYDGSGDIVLTMEQKATWDVGYERITALDNMKLEVIPEPATLGLIGIAGGALLFARRKFRG